VHWLTWHEISAFFKSWQGVIAGNIAVVATIYYGPRRVLETYDWYMDRFRDYKVRDFLRSNVIPPRWTARGEIGARATAKSITEISASTKMSQKQVAGSLKRLQRRHHVAPDGENWKAVL